MSDSMRLTTIRISREDAVEARTLTGARTEADAIRALVDEVRRTRRRQRLLRRAGTLMIDYVRPDDRGRR